MSRQVIELVNKSEYDKNVTQSTAKLVVVDFYANWCGPCKFVAPTVVNYANLPEFADVDFYKLDIEAVPEVAQECSITAMPTFKLSRCGVPVSEIVGANPEVLKKAIEAALQE